MDTATLRAFFMWCTILNGAVLLISFLVCAYARGFVERMHGKWFPMPSETLTVVLYSFIGLMKILFWMFSLVPFLALVILG